MSLFRDIGKKAEKLKQQVASSADKSYECADCGVGLHVEHDECPECGSDEVRTVE